MTRALAVLLALSLAACERNSPDPLPPATPEVVADAAVADAPLQVASDALPGRGTVLVLYGDTPLLRRETLDDLMRLDVGQ